METSSTGSNWERDKQSHINCRDSIWLYYKAKRDCWSKREDICVSEQPIATFFKYSTMYIKSNIAIQIKRIPWNQLISKHSIYVIYMYIKVCISTFKMLFTKLEKRTKKNRKIPDICVNHFNPHVIKLHADNIYSCKALIFCAF